MTIEDYLEHMPPLVPPADVHPMSRLMLERCPVARSDEDGGFWIINRHDDLLAVMQDWDGFANGNKGVRVPHMPIDQPPMPPLDSNPPLHRDVRRVMNPYLSPQALAPHEDEFRSIIRNLIEGFAADGHADMATDLAKKFPSDITTRYFFGVTDPDELDQLRHWARRLSYDMLKEDPAVLKAINADWIAWAQEQVDRRRAKPTADIVSGLVHAEVIGRKLTDEELVGAIQILGLAGFSTTADGTCDIICALIERPGLEQYLREHPDKIPAAIEEIMRLEPPVTARPRRATRDIEIAGHLIRKDERVLCNYLAANVDPDEWEDAEEFKLDRTQNRVMTFGAGPHRCIGSNMARLSLRLVTEELVRALTDIRRAEGRMEERVSFNPSAWRACDSLPVTFTSLLGAQS